MNIPSIISESIINRDTMEFVSEALITVADSTELNTSLCGFGGFK